MSLGTIHAALKAKLYQTEQQFEVESIIWKRTIENKLE